MKSILFIITLFVINVINSQTIRVKVYESIEYSEYDTTGVFSVISKISEPSNIVNRVNCEYVLNLTNKSLEFYRGNVLETETNFEFTNDNDLYIFDVHFDTNNIGLIINIDPRNETFDWYSKTGDYYEISKGLKFEIIKGF
jgi:hypothetical protein